MIAELTLASLPWLGAFLVLRGLFLILTPRKSNVSALACLALGGLALVLAHPWTSGSMPVAWVVLPFVDWLAMACGAIALYRLARMALAWKDPRGGFDLGVALWLLAAAALGWLGAHQDRPQLFTGQIELATGSAIGLAACAFGAVLLMAASTRWAFRKRWPKLVALHLSLTLGSLLFGLPFFWLLLTSFKEPQDLSSGSGLVWLPKVQVTEPYRDPTHPIFEATYEDARVQVSVLSRSGGQADVVVERPASLHGVTFVAPVSSLHEVDQQVPRVRVVFDGVPAIGRVIRELENGLRRVQIEAPARLDGKVSDFEPAQVEPIRKIGLRWANYSEALDNMPAGTRHGLVYLQNSLLLVVLNVLGTLSSSSLVAFAFARMRFVGRNLLFYILLSTMMLPAAVTLLPTFLIFRSLGWIDTLNPLWAPSFLGSAFNIFLLRQFFLTLPAEFEDAARIDGAGYLRTLWSVLLPQIKPALVAVAIWTAIGAWGNFMGPLIYISSPEKMTVSYAMQLFSGDMINQPGLLMAFATMAMLPVIALFFFAQKYFVEGIALTGLSGN